MRTLVIAGEYPWPADRGSRLRLAMTLRGLRRCGPTELFSVVSKFREEFGPPDEALGLASVGRVGFDNRTPSGPGLVPSLLRPGMPIGLPWRDRIVVQRALARFMSGHYDLVWFFGTRPWALAGEPVFAPTVLDVDDLEDEKILARLSMPAPPPKGSLQRVRRAGATVVSEEEVRRWRRLHRRASHRAAVVVCSQLDARRAAANDVRDIHVIANGYPAVADPVGRGLVGSPPTVLFQGLLRYPPNIDAARWLVHDVGPALRRLLPDAQIRLVGEAGRDVSALEDRPRVTVTGRVPDMVAELARADVVVVPVRYGSGTRLKILEAFAQRVPVVATTLGAEGLGAKDGVHLLIGDTAHELAAACARLLGEPDLRHAVVSRAEALFLERFSSDVIEEDIADLAREVAARAVR
jgi:glycosyltransferase involved in cell wall biosynthesis